MTRQRIALAADHGGFALKEALAEHLTGAGHEIVDCGTHSTEAVDYPTFAFQVASRVAKGEVDCGIVVDGAGIGSAMAANKVPGIRAAMCYDVSSALNSREHQDANVLTLGAGLIGRQLACQIADAWLTADCTAERHRRRIALIADMEQAWVESGSSPSRTAAAAGQATPWQPWVEGAKGEISNEDLERVAHRVQSLLLERGGILSEGLCAELPADTLKHFIDLGVCRVTRSAHGPTVPKELANTIDHTLLKPEATTDQVLELCHEARQHGFASVCINPTFVKLAARELRGSPTKVCTVVGFPLGAHTPDIKAAETRRAVRDGAREIDMVINVGALKGGDDALVQRDIRAVVDAAHDGGAICKVIIEAALLSDEEKVRACELSRAAKADYVKTSTGFGPGGATANDVALMAGVVQGARMGVKAAGGIRTLEDARAMLDAGATRIGASASLKILEEAEAHIAG